MTVQETLWMTRRRRGALRFRAVVLGAALLLSVNTIVWGFAAAGKMTSYRIVHVPEAIAVGRAEPIDQHEASRILIEFAAVSRATPGGQIARSTQEPTHQGDDGEGQLARVD